MRNCLFSKVTVNRTKWTVQVKQVIIPLLADLAIALAAHIFTSGKVGMIVSPDGGSALYADSCFFAVE